MELVSILILFFSGIGAGLMTGLVSASAVTFIAGVLILFLNFPAYDAIGISLLADVFASIASTHIYKKSSNVNIRGGLFIGIFATVFSFIGSLFARNIPDMALGNGLSIVILITGIAFIRNPIKRKGLKIFEILGRRRILASTLIGIFVGLFCGIFGAGGGVTILVALVFILKYPIKKAIGTSVLIMSFIALSGGIGHFIGRPLPWPEIIVASIGAVFGSIISSKYANHLSEEKMFKISGIILVILSLIFLFKKILFVSAMQILGF